MSFANNSYSVLLLIKANEKESAEFSFIRKPFAVKIFI
jgi:hypothetical protein